MLAFQNMLPVGCHHMQAITRVIEHFMNAPTIKSMQALAKPITDLFGTGALLTGQRFVVLVNVVVFKAVKGGNGMVQTCGRHAPRSNGGTYQVNRLGALRQPFPK